MQRALTSCTLRTAGRYGVARPPGWRVPRAVKLTQTSVCAGFHGRDLSAWDSVSGRARWFSSSASSATDRFSLEGRYGYALHAAAQGAKALEQVHSDVQGLQEAFQTSSDFAEFAKTAGVTAEAKLLVVQQIADRFKLHKVTKNFLCTVAENKRMGDLPKILSSFEELYRASRGEVRCFITSAQELTSGQKKEVIAALQKRAGPKSTILADFTTSPSVAGGLLVRMGDEVLDYTIATRIESLRTSLLTPLDA